VSTGDLNNATALGANATVNASNKVRIGGGNVTIVESAAGSWVTSDGRFKNNIKEDVKGLEFIKLLRPVTYNFDTKKFEEFLMQNYPDSLKQKRLEKMDKTAMARASAIIQSGFVAQEVAEAVNKSGYNFNGVHAPENPTDNWSLSYEKLVVPLVKAAQELSKQNDEKDTKITELESRLSKLEAMMNAKQSVMSDRLSANNANVSSLNRQQPSASLQQNVPNPFNHSTTINYSLPQQYSSAKIIVLDELGKTIQNINLSGRGKGSINFSSPFRAGASYQYSLYIDGKLIATKQMILAK